MFEVFESVDHYSGSAFGSLGDMHDEIKHEMLMISFNDEVWKVLKLNGVHGWYPIYLRLQVTFI